MITRKIVVSVLVLVSLLLLYASQYCCSVNVHEGEETEGSTHPLLYSHSSNTKDQPTERLWISNHSTSLFVAKVTEMGIRDSALKQHITDIQSQYHYSTYHSAHLQNYLASTLSSSNLSSPHTDVFGRPCDDSLCTQYLNKEELEKFRHCSEHLEKWAANNGTCQFLNGTSHGKVALASFPGSGNTWVRGLLEKATGLCTGSVYCDSSLRVAGFNGEGVSSSAVLVVKTHQSVRSFQAAIHLVRCPGDAIVSEWNRKRGTSQKGGKHSATASPADFGGNPEWDSFLRERSQRWVNGVLKLALYQELRPVLRVFYEDLKSNTTYELDRMLHFLNVPYASSHLLHHQLESRLQKLHRKRDRTFNPFTQQQKSRLKETLTYAMNELALRDHQESHDYVKKYMLTCNYN